MASPNNTQPATTQPTSPPTEPPTMNHAAGGHTTTTAPNTTNNSIPSQPPQTPATSLRDSGKSRRPRDVRLIHMLLASLGVSAYQDRVPLQLLDFAYRYTSNVLQDALHLSTEGYAGEGGGGAGGKGQDANNVSLSAVRLSIASRLHYQFQTGLPKEFLMDVASERNRIALPGASRGFDMTGNKAQQQANQSVLLGGMRLPPERFCLTGSAWTMRDEWESEGEEEVGEEIQGDETKEG
ncbi:transcription initiation factor TFIID, partial [Aspergillus sclerotialis]